MLEITNTAPISSVGRVGVPCTEALGSSPGLPKKK